MAKNKKKTVLWTLMVLFLLGMIVGGIGYYYLFVPQFYPKTTTYIYIDRDDTEDSIYHKVEKYARPGSMLGFRLLMEYKKMGPNVHTGRYPIRTKDNMYQVYKRFYRGHQEPMNLTISSVRTLQGLSRNIGKQLMIDSIEIASRISDPEFLTGLGYTIETLPSLFIPDTYQVYWDISLDDFFKRMKKEHDRFWNKDRLAKATALGMTPEEVCTLASIVEEETNNNEEKPMVAGLYINRLYQDMPLQADPTVKFALQDFSLRRITGEYLRVDSPYNTYIHTGLPPGPIRIPSKKGIDSVLNYTRHNYIYMCAKEDFSGRHNFASNYADHMINARRYWQALNERRIFK